MLYPKEDADNSQLMFACRTCTFSEPAASACVFRNILSNTVGETEGVTQDVASDPTVGDPDSALCSLCGLVITCELCGQSMFDSPSEASDDALLGHPGCNDRSHDLESTGEEDTSESEAEEGRTSQMLAAKTMHGHHSQSMEPRAALA